MITAALVLLVFAPIAAAYVAGVLLLRRLVRLWEGRDVMASLRPSRQRVAATDRLIDDIHYDVVVGQ